jgi:hypothetical protein
MGFLQVAKGPLHVIEVDPMDVTITSDDVISFSAKGYDRQGNDLGIVPTWEVSGGGTIDENGNFTPDKIGSWTVYANLSGVSGHADITVVPGILAVIEIFTDSYSISADDTLPLEARGYDSDGNEVVIDPEWTAEGGGTIDGTGNFSGDVPGMWKIFATQGAIRGTIVIEVNPGALDRIEIEPSEVTLNISETFTFSALGFDADGNPVEFDPGWRTNGGGLMHVSGIYTAQTPGTWTVYCNSSGVSGEAEVMVNSPSSGDDDDDDIVPHEREDDGGLSVLIVAVIMAIVLLAVIGFVVLMVMINKKKGKPPAQPIPQAMMPAPPLAQLPHQGIYESLPQVQQPVMEQGYLPPPVDIQPQPGQQMQQIYPTDQTMEQNPPIQQTPQQDNASELNSPGQSISFRETGDSPTTGQEQVEVSEPSENGPITTL